LAHCYWARIETESYANFGHSGTGFSEKELADAIDRLKPFFTEKPSVENLPKIQRKSNGFNQSWFVKLLSAEWTEDEQLRQTTLLGWRDDKNPEEVVLEKTA